MHKQAYKRRRSIASVYNSLLRKKRHLSSDSGISEVVGTLLLIGIGISLFSVLMLLVMNITTVFNSSMGPSTNLIGIYEPDTRTIIFENRGGESVPIQSIITLSFADIPPVTFTAAEYMSPHPSPNDNLWDVGERVVFNNTSWIPNFDLIEIHVSIKDPTTNSILMNGVLREGTKEALPYTITGTPVAINTRTETFSQIYDFQLYSNHPGWGYWARFSYKKLVDVNWTSYNWTTANSTHGSYTLTAQNLTPGTVYLYRAEICWGTNPSINPLNYTTGSNKQFETGTDYVGIWHFDETAPADALLAKDSTINHNNGTLLPSSLNIRPLRVSTGVHSTKAITFDGVNDYTKIPDSTSLRAFTNDQTIECWIKPQTHRQGTRGVITANDISQYSQTLESYGFTDPDIIPVSGQYYAIVTRGANTHGYLIVVNVTSTGIIRPKSLLTTPVAVLDFDSAVCWTPKIIHTTGTQYAIVYCRGGSYSYAANGYIKTLNILPTGTIGSTIGTLSIGVSYFNQPKILPITGTIYAIFYNTGTPNYQMRVMTVNIPTAGNPTTLSTFSINTIVANDPAPVQVGTDGTNYYYAVAYRDSDSDGYMTAVSITNDGLSLTQIDQALDNDTIQYSVMFDSDDCWAPCMIPVGNTGYYICSYTGSVNKYVNYGYVRTFNISSTGIVSNATPDYSAGFKVIDGTTSSWVFGKSKIIAVDQDTYLVVYQYSMSTTYYGLAQTVDIAVNGSVIYYGTSDHRFTFESANGCITPAVVQVGGTGPYYFGVVYSRATNTTNQGMIKTFSVTNAGIINQPCINEALLGPYHFWNPYIFPLATSTYYAMVYNTEYNNGITITTTRILANGDVQDVFLSRAGFLSGRINSVKLQYIKNNVYVLFYYNYSTGIVARSLKIYANGTIDTTGSRTWTYATSYANTIDLLKITNSTLNDIYAISFHSKINATAGTYMITVHINSTGGISAVIDTLIINDAASNTYNVLYDTSLRRVNNSVGGPADIFAMTFAWKYSGSIWYGVGRVITVEITIGTGMITDIPKATFDFNQYITRATLTRVYSDIYAIAYNDKSGVGMLRTIRISDDGTSITLIDPGPSSSSLSSQLLAVNATNNIFAVVTDTTVKTLRINEKGDISNSTSGVFEDSSYSLSNSKNVQAIKLADKYYAFIYAGTYYDAYLQTLTITPTTTKRQILYKAGSYNVSADDTNAYISITDSASPAVTHAVTIQLSYVNDWNYIVCLYKIGSPMKVYINGNDTAHNGRYRKTAEVLTAPIAQSTQPLYFGGYNAVYDEFAIGTKIFSEPLIKTMYLNMLT